MTTPARKSSVGGTRRGPQKAHIPYRGDNPAVGKKTGIAVRHVQRKSDGFEPFEEIMQQADKRTPPRVKGKYRRASVPVADHHDEYGEMSMELDDSPLQYFVNARPLTTPSALRRVASSLRPVTRTSDIDFDQVPSPRPRGSIRRSLGNISGPGPSRLSRSANAHSAYSPDNGDGVNNIGGFDDYGPEEDDSPAPASPRRTSFTEMDQEDDDEEEGEEEAEAEAEAEVEDEGPSTRAGARQRQMSSPTRLDKGKGRAVLPEAPEADESDIEEEPVHPQSDEDDAEEEPPDDAPRRGKKAKITFEEAAKPKGRPRGKSKKGSPPVREGVRKSAREHYKPLEWWRGEKLVYGRSRSTGGGAILVPPIREIVRIPKEQPEPLGKRKRPLPAKGRNKSKEVERPVQVQVVPIENPEEGWDDDTDPKCVVLDFPSMEEVSRRIAFTAKMLNPSAAANSNWAFQKVFGDADFIAAGVLVIPPHGRKPSKGTKDNTYIFYVIEGAVNLKVHETSLVLATGAMFLVPRGNTYFIENIADRDAKLFFTQARKLAPDEDELGAVTTPGGSRALSAGSARAGSDAARRPAVGGRSSSAGPSSGGGAAHAGVRQNGYGNVNGRGASKAVGPARRAVSTRI